MPLTCEHCRKAFEPTQRFCCRACKQRHRDMLRKRASRSGAGVVPEFVIRMCATGVPEEIAKAISAWRRWQIAETKRARAAGETPMCNRTLRRWKKAGWKPAAGEPK